MSKVENLNKRTLESCSFSEDDDLQYLLNDQEWIEKKSEKLRENEKVGLVLCVQQLRQMDTPLITTDYLTDFFNTFIDADSVNAMTLKRRVEVRSIFVATVVRELILRIETSGSMEYNRSQFLDKYPFLKNQEGTDTELTWLNRFERALRYLAPLMVPLGNKQYFLNVGAHLQGSDIYVEYITGGANRPETQRRVDLFEAVTNVKPKPRAPRNMKKLITEPAIKRGRGRPRKDPNQPSVPSANTSKTLKKTKAVQKMDCDDHMQSVPFDYPQIPASNYCAIDDELYEFTDEELLDRLRSIDEETDIDPMDLIFDLDVPTACRTPTVFSQYGMVTENNMFFREEEHPVTATHAFSPAGFYYGDSTYSQRTVMYANEAADDLVIPEIEMLDQDDQEDMDDEEDNTYQPMKFIRRPTSFISGKKRTLSLNDLLDKEIEEFLMAIDGDDEKENDEDNANHQITKKMISLQRSRGFAKIPIADIPIHNAATNDSGEFPNRSIISYRFNIASVSSQDSTDISTVDSIEPDEDVGEDEIVNDVEACFEGLLIY